MRPAHENSSLRQVFVRGGGA